MFKLNTTKEIFYIFLWLIGIIAFYALVHTYILEPKSETSVVYTKNDVSKDKVAVQKVIAHTSEAKTTISHTKTKAVIKPEKITALINTADNIVVPVTLTNDVSKVVKKTTKVVESKKVPKKMLEKLKEVSKKTEDTKKETLHVTSRRVEENHSPKISTPAVPSIPSVVTAVSVPSVPVAPSVPSTPSIVTEDLDLQIEKLKHELSTDDKMKLLETARQLIVEKAETVHDTVIKTIK